MTRQEQGTVLFSALLALVGVGVVVQLWLLSASVLTVDCNWSSLEIISSNGFDVCMSVIFNYD